MAVPSDSQPFIAYTESSSKHIRADGEAAFSKTMSSASLVTEGDAPAKKFRANRLAKRIVDDKFFVGFTTFLTVFALTGDDCRLLFTPPSCDEYFNGLVVACFFVFSFECFLSCLGKEDYYLGFFFWLDIISTLTLILDFTPVSTAMLTDPDDFGDGTTTVGGDNARTGRSAKIGAKAGRVVRVLRLVRLLKLYKHYYEAQMRRRAAEARKRQGITDDDDWGDEEIDEDDGRDRAESRVGKKLSEMTTRRLIILILAMLLGMPAIQPEWDPNLAPFYAADRILSLFGEYKSNRTDTLAKEMYEQSILQFAYYFNEFAGYMKFCDKLDGNCPDHYSTRLFWIGIMGDDAATVEQEALVAQINDAIINRFDAMAQNQHDIYNFGIMPEAAKGILGSTWTTKCDRVATRTQYRRGISLLSKEISGFPSRVVTCPEDLRLQERDKFYPRTLTLTAHTKWHFAFYFDKREAVQDGALWNLIRTLFVLVVLIMGSLMFSNDANRLVVNPVEKMIKRVECIRDDPLQATKMADEEFRVEQVMEWRKRKESKFWLWTMFKAIVSCEVCDTKTDGPLETVILEKSIIKLGSLLILGLGEAGANIIGSNMGGSDTADVNAMIPGRKVKCIVGNARVLDFAIATEVLQAKIMTFVNQIAEIVHGVVNEYHGAPNKNSGDTFLIIWRLGPEKKVNNRIAEFSVVAFALILGAVHRSATLGNYRGHPGLQMRLKDFRVNLRFGLHRGWAIEGAVGSEFKIDASYLSPNVSIAMTMERLTHTYGVSLLVSQSIVEVCAAPLVRRMRLIDTVKIKGSKTPMDIYCVDLDWGCVQVAHERPLDVKWNNRNRFKVRQFLESEKAAKMADDFQPSRLFTSDPVISSMRQRYTVEFFQLYNMGFQNYSQGEWHVAKRLFTCTQALLGVEDGPSKALLKFMESHDFTAPPKWAGVRAVDP